MKKLKNGPKSGREKGKMPVKKPKKRPKMAFTGTFDFHGKKKTLIKSASDKFRQKVHGTWPIFSAIFLRFFKEPR